MKKMLAVLTVGAFLMAPAFAFAECNGDECIETGNFKASVEAFDGAIDGGIDFTYKGAAGGVGAAGGATFGEMESKIEGEGDAYGSIKVTGGGIVNGNGYEWWNFQNGIEHGIGSYSTAEAVTAGDLTLEVDSDQRYKSAKADGSFEGVAGQGTLNFSVMGEAPIFMNDGFTGGIAAQASAGFIKGGVDVESDYWNCYNVDRDSANASIFMNGSSESRSWRGVEYLGGGYRTEYMGTRSIAYTNVESNDRVSGPWYDSYASGGFLAGGVAANKTVMEGANGVGKATAVGFYAGGGELDCNFTGYANATTSVAVTSQQGAKGSIVTSSAQVTVSTNGESIPQQ